MYHTLSSSRGTPSGPRLPCASYSSRASPTIHACVLVEWWGGRCVVLFQGTLRQLYGFIQDPAARGTTLGRAMDPTGQRFALAAVLGALSR